MATIVEENRVEKTITVVFTEVISIRSIFLIGTINDDNTYHHLYNLFVNRNPILYMKYMNSAQETLFTKFLTK